MVKGVRLGMKIQGHVVLYAKDTATFNEGHTKMSKSLGKTI